MILKDILIHVDVSARSGMRVDIAADLAERYDAQLTALWTIDLPSTGLFYGDPSTPIDPVAVEEIIGRIRAEGMARAAPAEASFRERIRRDGLEGEWRVAEGPAPEAVALHARYADLAIVGQPDPEQTSLVEASQVAATTLLSAGRPVLVVPYAGRFAAVGGTVLVAWKSSREAARAVNDAMPLLQQARSVTVLSVTPPHETDNEAETSTTEVVRHLARHGITAKADQIAGGDVPEGDVLLNYANETGADLLVAGGYGRSRVREFVFGGVTRTLLEEMTLPVLLSH